MLIRDSFLYTSAGHAMADLFGCGGIDGLTQNFRLCCFFTPPDSVSSMLQTDTPYGTPYGSFSSLSSMQTPPHSLSGYSPMTHLPGLASSYHSTPGRSGGPASSLQVLHALPCVSYSLLFN